MEKMKYTANCIEIPNIFENSWCCVHGSQESLAEEIAIVASKPCTLYEIRVYSVNLIYTGKLSPRNLDRLTMHYKYYIIVDSKGRTSIRDKRA